MTVNERVESLERSLLRVQLYNRLLLLGGVALLVSLSFNHLVVAQDAKSAKTISATSFELVDSTGKVCAVLGVGLTGPQLVLADESGKPRATLAVEGGKQPGVRLELVPADGIGGATLLVSDKPDLKHSTLTLSRHDGPRNISVGSFAKGEQHITFWSSKLLAAPLSIEDKDDGNGPSIDLALRGEKEILVSTHLGASGISSWDPNGSNSFLSTGGLSIQSKAWIPGKRRIYGPNGAELINAK